MSRLNVLDDVSSKRSHSVRQNQTNKQMAMLAEQLEQMTIALKQKSQEVAMWKEKAESIKPQTIIEKVDNHEEINKLQQTIEQKTHEHQKLIVQFQALEKAYIESNTQLQQFQTQQLLVNNRTNQLIAENHHFKQQLAILTQNLYQSQQQCQQLATLRHSSSENELANQKYKQQLEQKQEEINILKNQLDSTEKIIQKDFSRDSEIANLKSHFENELRSQREISREMLRHEEERVRKDEQDRARDKFETLQLELAKAKNTIQNLVEEKNQLEQQFYKSKFVNEQEQQDKMTIQILQNEIESLKKVNMSFTSTVFDTTTNDMAFKKELEKQKNREVQELTFQNQIIREQVQKKIDQIVQLESENETLKERARMSTLSAQSEQSSKIQSLLNHIDNMQRNLVTPTVKDNRSTPKTEELRIMTEMESFPQSASNTQRCLPQDIIGLAVTSKIPPYQQLQQLPPRPQPQVQYIPAPQFRQTTQVRQSYNVQRLA